MLESQSTKQLSMIKGVSLTLLAMILTILGLIVLIPLIMNYSVRTNISFTLLSLFFLINSSMIVHYVFLKTPRKINYTIVVLISIIMLLCSIIVFPFTIFQQSDKSAQVLIEENRVQQQFIQEKEAFDAWKIPQEKYNTKQERRDILGIG